MTARDACTVASHEAVKRDDAAWAALDLRGVQHVEADDAGPAEALELRNCACGSTLCRTVRA